MKKIFLAFLLFAASTTAFAEDSIKIEYHPGMSRTDRSIELKIAKATGEDDEAFQKVFDSLKAIEATGRLDYIVPDAPYITLNVNYKGHTIIAKNTPSVPKAPGYEAFQKAWDEAYTLAWGLVESRMNP